MPEKIVDEDDINNKILLKYGYTMKNEVLGSGSFSTVVAAYSEKHQVDVAIKIIQKVSGAKVFLTKFLPRELQTMKELVHPNIIGYYKAIETNFNVSNN